MPPRLSPQAVRLLADQSSVIAAWQAYAPSHEAMSRAVKRGEWRNLAPGVFLSTPAPAQDEQYLWAAALSCGTSGMLSGQAALNAHGWKGERRGPIDVVAHPGANARAKAKPTWIRLHRTTVMPRAAKGGIPRARPPRATIDAAAWAESDEEAEMIVVSVLQQRLVTGRELSNELADLPVVNRRRKVLEIIDEFDSGITSMNELRFARLCREHGIREPDRQVRRRDSRGDLRRLDVYWDAEGVVVEIDGIGHNELAEEMDDDFRQNSLVISGDRRFLRVSTAKLRHDPDEFIGQLVDALEQGAADRAGCG